MPQLDFFSISNQFFWGIFYFIFFYLIITYYVIPSIFSSIFARNFYISNSSNDSAETLYYSFTAFFLFSTFYSEYDVLLNVFHDDIKLSAFSYYVALFETLSVDINSSEAIELFFNNHFFGSDK